MDIYDATLGALLRNAKQNPVSYVHRYQIAKTILDTLIFIQLNDIRHLDIKPSNILLNLSNGQWNGKDLVISDFGLSSNNYGMLRPCGTPGYGSPEQFVGKYSDKSDNYAYVKLFVLCIFPWETALCFLMRPVPNDEIRPYPSILSYHSMEVDDDICNNTYMTLFTNGLNVRNDNSIYCYYNYFKGAPRITVKLDGNTWCDNK